MRSKGLSDKRVRQALALAIDRQLLVDKVTLGGQQPQGGFVPAGFEAYETIPAPAPDVARARHLLAEAGDPGGKGFPKYEILINTAEINRKLAEAIQAMWKANLGIEIGIYNQEWKVFLDARDAGNFDISRGGWYGFYPGPGAYLTLMTCDSPNNDTGWCNERFDALVRQAQASGDIAERARLMRQAEDILIDEMPVIPLFGQSRNRLIDPRLKGTSRDAPWTYKFLRFED